MNKKLIYGQQKPRAVFGNLGNAKLLTPLTRLQQRIKGCLAFRYTGTSRVPVHVITNDTAALWIAWGAVFVMAASEAGYLVGALNEWLTFLEG